MFFVVALFSVLQHPPADPPAQNHRSALDQLETVAVQLELATGGSLEGAVIDHNDHGIVVLHGTDLHVFAWTEIDASSAFMARRFLMARERGGEDRLLAEDYFQLGLFALSRGRSSAAIGQFNKAKAMDAAYTPAVKDALAEFRRSKRNKPRRLDSSPPDDAGASESPDEPVVLGALTDGGAEADSADAILETYRRWGNQVHGRISNSIKLIETDHFLIWTDWHVSDHARLAELCESMYSALCAEFGADAQDRVFLAKCPIFCWRAKARFRQFARLFDKFEAPNALGYTRSAAQTGHVHVVAYCSGDSDEDFDRFACTLVHEGTHAFLHRFHSNELIPHWINEGLAELMAERVLRARCPGRENADLLAGVYVEHDLPIMALVRQRGPIAVHEYSLAHSLIAYLESRGENRLAELIRALKDGRSLEAALEQAFDLTPESLDEGWRAWVLGAGEGVDK